MPLPFKLHAEPSLGVIRVRRGGNGLCAGDVLRACSTFHVRVQSDPWLRLLPVRRRPVRPPRTPTAPAEALLRPCRLRT